MLADVGRGSASRPVALFRGPWWSLGQLPRASSERPNGPTIGPPLLRSLPLRGDEERVVGAYANWLERNGRTVIREVESADVYAERGQERLYAEAKRRTDAIGLDVDTLYGQLLREDERPRAAARYSRGADSRT